ncbi:CUB and sushi domain-containing protein 3 [Lingula anatina]|uniref:CUB and sushi domain-containing protein 3 n=1 Tax=Lingula anatina TaxID=7574 RepID=A0A1S3ITQ3_LINAN|nr:CUB and sushi domain-containing protein 3 [Lingula anatina]XP_013401577.1 CUB and sushi domain-containing protein 3 [Lingula anatina]|eukprot:XP_013401568.1 CUB and sushi domain-containing protein 3 [Lingula anatina]
MNWTHYDNGNQLAGNTDFNKVVLNTFKYPFLAQHVRLYPNTSTCHNNCSLRMEMYGCKYSSFDHGDYYVGCIVETMDPNLSPVMERVISTNCGTPAACVDLCRDNGYLYAGLSGDNCSCSNSVDKYGRSSHSYCHITCSGDSSAFCGGHYRYSVWRTWDVRCPAVPLVGNASASTSNREHNVKVTYSCLPGFHWPSGTLEEHKSITCQVNNWTATPPACEVAQCTGNPQTVSNATLTQSGNSYLDVATYTCIENHAFQDGTTTKQASCLSNGQWDNSVPSACIRPQCPAVSSSLSYTTANSSDHEAGAAVRYECSPNSTFSDGSSERTRRCLVSGHWDSTEEACGKGHCELTPHQYGGWAKVCN